MGRNPATGVVFGVLAIGLAVFNMVSDASGETPPQSVNILNYVLLAMGLLGFVGSLVVYLKRQQKDAGEG